LKAFGHFDPALTQSYFMGYRIYFIQSGEVVIVLLAGGNKSTQGKDIRHAKALAIDLKEF
jgi:putative addiction module killer protein